MESVAVWVSLPLGIMGVHRVAVWVAMWRGSRRAVNGGSDFSVTWLRPLKAGVPELGEKLERFLTAIGAEDDVVFGVEADSDEARLCESLAVRDTRVKVVVCDLRAAANPKVAKLMAMSRHARHERWIVVDAEARIDGEFARAFRGEWEGADVVTAGYRFTGMRTWAQRLDALAVVQTLWPGLELVRAFGRVRFTLGACTGVRRADVEAIGGWAGLRGELAEDFHLGARLAEAGKSVRISGAVLELESEPMTWRDYWRHQRRVAVTYRVAAPAGTCGMILTRGFTLCALLAVLCPEDWTMLNAGLAAGLHVLAVAIQSRRIGARLGGWFWLSLAADLVEAACWVSSWGSNRVWWGGKWRAITRRGQFKTNSSGEGW